MRTDVVVGVDLGTSGLKAVALGADGEVIGQVGARYPTARPAPGASEQRPDDWLAAMRSAIGDLGQVVPPRQWRALGLSGMIPTLVAVGPGGAPVRPAITWEDSRAEPQAAAIRAAIGADIIYQRTGQWLDGRYLLPMLARLTEAGPPDADPIVRMAGAKDYLLWWLTGEWCTDPSTATGYGCYDLRRGRWDDEIVTAVSQMRQSRGPGLPEIASSGQRLPLAGGRAAELGLPADLQVVVGAADSVLAALGLGVRQPGDAAYVAGTSTVILGVSKELVLDPEHRYLVTPLAGIAGWGLEMDLLATGSAVRWLSRLFGCDEAELVALAEPCDPVAAPCFLPFLAPGEQGALWDPSLTGTLSGLSLHHHRGHLARGLLTGITLESRRCLRLLAQATGSAGTLRVAGGSAASAVFRQDLANASGREVVADSGFADYSALGAAMLAAVSSGLPAWPGRPAGGAPATHRPVGDESGTWSDLAARHDDLLRAVRPAGASARPITP